MARITRKLVNMAIGGASPAAAGRLRMMRGMRETDSREFYIGLALMGLAYLRRTQAARRELLYRRTLPEGTALVIHHKGKGEPRLAIVKPKKPRR